MLRAIRTEPEDSSVCVLYMELFQEQSLTVKHHMDVCSGQMWYVSEECAASLWCHFDHLGSHTPIIEFSYMKFCSMCSMLLKM